MIALNNASQVRFAIIFAILFAYVFLVASVAAAPSLASQLTVSKYIEPGDNANLTSLALVNISKEAVVLVRINDAEIFLLNDTAGQPITDYDTVYRFLDADFYRSSNYSKKIDSVMETVDRFDSGKQWEWLCKRMTGLDTHNCTSMETCIVSCNAVPICQEIVYSAGVVESILDYSNQLAAYNQSFAALKADLQQAKTANSAQPAVDEFKKFNSIVSAIDNSKLFDECRSCYGICRAYNWSRADLKLISTWMSQLAELDKAHSKLGNRTAALIANTNATIDYLTARSGIKDRLASKIQAMEGNLTDDFNRTSSVVGVSELVPMYMDFLNLSNATRGYLGRNSVRRALANEPILDGLNATLTSEIYKRKMAVVDYQRFCYRIGQKLLELSSNRTLIDQKKELDAINVRYAAIRDDVEHPTDARAIAGGDSRSIKTYDSLIATNSELESMDNHLAKLIGNGRSVVPIGDFCIVSFFIMFPAVAYLCVERKRHHLPK